jgi:serine/threonine protein kinase, bacterial
VRQEPSRRPPTALPFTGLSQPVDVAMDSAGSVCITDKDNDRVLKLPVQ